MISQSYAAGAVSAGDLSLTGGLVGFNLGYISDTYDTGAVTGGSAVGGLIGVNSGYSYGMDVPTVLRSYATGTVGQSSSPTGGLIGQSSTTVIDLVWNVGTTGTAVAIGTVFGNAGAGTTPIGGFTGKDPTQASSYVGFDFVNVWTIVPGSSAPTLLAPPIYPTPE